MTSESIPAELLEVRKKIDLVDAELISLLAERFVLTHQVGMLKASNELDAVDAVREAEKLDNLRSLCLEHDLNPDLITELFTRIMEEVVNNHQQLRDQ